MMKDSNSIRILVIEDNLGDFILINDYLNEMMDAPEIVHCQTFKQAKVTLENHSVRFDIILLDMKLPDKSGQNLLDSILPITNNSPLIILSGNSELSFSLKAISLGVDDYLIKSDLRPSTLYKAIIYCLERRKREKELKESRKRYKELFDLSPQPMWVYDVDTLEFVDVNFSAMANYGYSREEFLSMKLSDIRPVEEIPELLKSIEFLRTNENRPESNIYVHKKKNNEILYAEIHANSFHYENRNVRIILANDVTEQIKYIQSVEQQNKKLSEIAWIQSHVVRAPLARMMGLIQFINSDSDLSDEESKMINENILESAHELDNIIKDITQKVNEPI